MAYRAIRVKHGLILLEGPMSLAHQGIANRQAAKNSDEVSLAVSPLIFAASLPRLQRKRCPT
jgi:hypothetical protein